MQRLLVNGSPRGTESNSRLILQWISQGLDSQGIAQPQIIDLAEKSRLLAHRATFLAAEEVVLVFPLYTDSFPGLVKQFIDSWISAEPDQIRGKRIGFVVQSGFPESIHSETVARWLARLCARLGLVNLGIVLRGGVEGIRVMPESMSKKLRADFTQLGASLAQSGKFDQAIIQKLAKPRTLSLPMRGLFSLLKPTGLLNFYWNSQLKKYGAWSRRFDQPYANPQSFAAK